MKRFGISLVEIIVVIAIILIAGAIALPAIARSKLSAQRADDISKMRQLGVAQGLYMEANNDIPAISTVPLVKSGIVPKSVVVSARDRTSSGLANVLAKGQIDRGFEKEFGVEVVNYKSSFPGSLEYSYHLKFFQDNILKAKNPGWLVNVVELVPRIDDSISGAHGNYDRLLMDGSIQRRRQGFVTVLDQGANVQGTHPILLFVDEDGSWTNNLQL